MQRSRWIDRLSGEDISFIKRFVLASGSLKKLAEQYGISYPTVRLRLDRVIQKIEIFDAEQPMSEFERQLRAAFAEGKLDQATFERLLEVHRQDLQSLREGKHEDSAVQARD